MRKYLTLVLFFSRLRLCPQGIQQPVEHGCRLGPGGVVLGRGVVAIHPLYDPQLVEGVHGLPGIFRDLLFIGKGKAVGYRCV